MAPEGSRRRRCSARAAALLPLAAAGIGLAYLWGVLIPGRILQEPEGFGGIRLWDFETYFLPKFAFGSQEILHGHLPLWNPFEFGGIPFLATAQPAALYLPKILVFASWDAETAIRVFLISQFMMLAAAFLVFVRDQKIGAIGALAGVLFYAFNLPLLNSNGHPTAVANAVWVPLIFLFGDRLGRWPGPGTFAALSLVVAVLATAGYPEFVMDCGFLVASHAVVRYLAGDWTLPPWRTVPLLAGAFLLGAMVAGIQVLPLAELVLTTGRLRMAGEVASRVALGPLLPAVTLALVLSLPGLTGFALAGIERRNAAPVTGLLLCAAMLLGVWKLLRFIPGFGAVRLPGTWPLLSQFFLAWLVACGAGRFAGAGPGREERRSPAVLVGATGGLWAAACITWAMGPEQWTTGLPRSLSRIFVSDRVWMAAGAGATGGMLLLLLALPRRRIRGAGIVTSAAILLVVAGHLSTYPFGVPIGRLAFPRTPYRSSALIPEKELHEGRILSLFDARGGYHLRDRVENPFGREGSLPPPRFTLLEKRLGVVVQTLRIAWDQVTRSRALLDTLDVRRVVAPRRMAASWRRIGFHPTGQGKGPIEIFETGDSPGRAWGVYGVRVVASPEDALDLLLSPGFDARHQVILERAPGATYPAITDRPPARARVRHLRPTFTEVEVEMERSGVLLLADACFPGWQATVDGRPAEILCANFLARGVELGSGRHVVRYRYRPASVRRGIASSVAATSLVVGVLLFVLRRRRTGRASERVT